VPAKFCTPRPPTLFTFLSLLNSLPALYPPPRLFWILPTFSCYGLIGASGFPPPPFFFFPKFVFFLIFLFLIPTSEYRLCATFLLPQFMGLLCVFVPALIVYFMVQLTSIPTLYFSFWLFLALLAVRPSMYFFSSAHPIFPVIQRFFSRMFLPFIFCPDQPLHHGPCGFSPPARRRSFLSMGFCPPLP